MRVLRGARPRGIRGSLVGARGLCTLRRRTGCFEILEMEIKVLQYQAGEARGQEIKYSMYPLSQDRVWLGFVPLPITVLPISRPPDSSRMMCFPCFAARAVLSRRSQTVRNERSPKLSPRELRISGLCFIVSVELKRQLGGEETTHFIYMLLTANFSRFPQVLHMPSATVASPCMSPFTENSSSRIRIIIPPFPRSDG